MALATIICGFLYAHVDLEIGGSTFLDVIWALWLFDQFFSLALCFGMLYYMCVRLFAIL
jgi:hypothetical protein